MNPQGLVELRDLVKVYATGDVEVRALDGIDLKIDEGEFVAVMGPSGSGKSTLMNILGCLDRPTSGHYFLGGDDVARMDSDERAEIRNARIGFVFQNFNLLSRTSALENVELPLIYGRQGYGPHERAEKAMSMLAKVGLTGREKHNSSQLSGGQQQRVAIARALITEAPILLADEPTGNLDTKTSIEVMAIFQRLNDDGKTVIVITHEPDIAEHAKRVVTFRDGRIVSDAPVKNRKRATLQGTDVEEEAR
ncbi:MAG: ABC transporter ATP-binding protein [Candidatus Polarisedimenticolia bacterium]